ncbi:hypothetical protein MycrhDRAFT_1968 [Mycolicibacterium rhodesiae JS60]|nr:hypothetical protein MycrhDRAFT_1968 [Mycolicibacterium rhodesiae JS60]
MTDENTTETTTVDDTEVDQTAAGEQNSSSDTLLSTQGIDEQPDTFPREVVEDLRRENGRYRQRAGEADSLANRLHTELVRATGRLADPTDLPFNADHLDDADALAAAIDELLTAKPHLASRRPAGDIGQGQRGPASSSFSLLDMLKERT